MRMNLILAALLFSVFQAWLTTGVDAVKVLLFQNAFGQSHIGFSDSLVKALHNNGGHVVVIFLFLLFVDICILRLHF